MTLYEIISKALEDGCGYEQEEARSLAQTILQWGFENGHSGAEHYWPSKVRSIPKAERDDAIRREFNGTNLNEICARFGVSHTTVYLAAKGRDKNAGQQE